MLDIVLNKLEAAINNTDLTVMRKLTYKSILLYRDGKICISKGIKALMPEFVRSEDIRKIKNELKNLESEELK